MIYSMDGPMQMQPFCVQLKSKHQRTALFNIICFYSIVCSKLSCSWNAIQRFCLFKVASFSLVKWHYSLCYTQLESVAISYSHRKYNSMSCYISTLIGSECGTTSSKLNIMQEMIPISLYHISRTTVCPKHLYQLGGGWFQIKVCHYPDHTGKAGPDRSINKLQSKIIFNELKNLVPVGSGKITLFVLM